MKTKKRTTALATRKASLPKKAAEGVKAISAVDPQALLAQAIDKNLPIESMERLLALRDKMKAEFAREQFFIAFSQFQKDCPVVGKEHKATIKSRKGEGSSFSYQYAPLEDIVAAVQPAMEKWGFSWTCKPSQTDGHVRAIVHVHHRDGHEEVTEFEVPLNADSYISDPQKAAAALTFARRYAFINAFGITTKGEDNDAQPDDEPQRGRAPIRTPQERKADDAVPVQHEEKKAPTKLGDYDEIIFLLASTSKDPKTKQTVKLFSDNEVVDYTHQAKEARDKPEELKVILKDVVDTGHKRHKAVKGEA